jgi:L-fuconate dehydratase
MGPYPDCVVAAIAALRPYVVGGPARQIADDVGGFSAGLTGNSRLRRFGPEEGVMRIAIGAFAGAARDLAALAAGKPLWRLLAEIAPEQIVGLVGFRCIDGALTPPAALGIQPGAAEGRRVAGPGRPGRPACATTPGWVGYAGEKSAGLSRQAVIGGFGRIKLQVGAGRGADARCLARARKARGPGIRIATDASQGW